MTLIAPHVFKGYWEFHLGLAGTALIFLIILFSDRNGRLYAGNPLMGMGIFYICHFWR